MTRSAFGWLSGARFVSFSIRADSIRSLRNCPKAACCAHVPHNRNHPTANVLIFSLMCFHNPYGLRASPTSVCLRCPQMAVVGIPLRSVDEQRFLRFDPQFAIAVRLLLTCDAQSSPWQRVQTFRADLFLAVEARAVCAVFDAAQRCAHAAQQLRLTFQIASRQLAFCSKLHFVQCIRSFLNRNTVTLSHQLRQLDLVGLKDCLEYFQFVLSHCGFLQNLKELRSTVFVGARSFWTGLMRSAEWVKRSGAARCRI